ncbi:hypothetical protein JOQ06_019289, partial [Pogonophryne albipinna]
MKRGNPNKNPSGAHWKRRRKREEEKLQENRGENVSLLPVPSEPAATQSAGETLVPSTTTQSAARETLIPSTTTQSAARDVTKAAAVDPADWPSMSDKGNTAISSWIT